jgi:hypothetical protein
VIPARARICSTRLTGSSGFLGAKRFSGSDNREGHCPKQLGHDVEGRRETLGIQQKLKEHFTVLQSIYFPMVFLI